MRAPVNKVSLALVLLVLAPVLLLSGKYVRFQPASWWLDAAFTPSLLLAILVPVMWLIRKSKEPDGRIRQPSGLPENAFIFNILPAIASFGLILVSAYVTLPGVVALALGGVTSQQITAQMNMVGSVDAPSRWCRNKAVIADHDGSLFGRLCFDSKEDKTLARSMGPRVTIDLHGWGNSFGIYYTSTEPVGPAAQ